MVDAQLNINLFDGIVFTVLILSALISLFRGFIREFLSLATWIGAGLITLALADDAIALMSGYFSSKMAAAVIGTMGTYFLVLIVVGSLSRLLVRYVKDGTEVGWVDNVMGLLFGVLKGGLVIVLGFILMTLIFKEDGMPEWVRTASTLPAVKQASISVVRFMPEYLGTISSLSGEPEEAVPVDGEDPIEEGLAQELMPAEVRDPAIQQEAAGALEQLINDVTKPREVQDEPDFNAEEGMPQW